MAGFFLAGFFWRAFFWRAFFGGLLNFFAVPQRIGKHDPVIECYVTVAMIMCCGVLQCVVVYCVCVLWCVVVYCGVS